MTEINLLPWRENEREAKKKNFVSLLLLTTIFSILMIIMLNYYADEVVNSQLQRNELLNQEIKILDKQIVEIKGLKAARKNLISRMMIIHGLESTRSLTVHLFDEIIKVLPDGVYLTQIKRVGEQITVTGYSESNTNISLLMRNIQSSPWIQEPILTEIKKTKQDVHAIQNEFILNFILKPH